MIHLYLILYFRVSLALLLSTENRISTRNITCQHGIIPMTTLFYNCEACLITSRNYPIETALSLTGAGPADFSYACLQVNNVEAFHENLVRECHYFSKDTLNGYDDFCIASPYNIVRGSYRACICITNECNFNYLKCIRQVSAIDQNSKTMIFSNTIMELTNKVKCYQSFENYNQQTNSNLIQLCSNNDEQCRRYVFNHGVLCLINVDRTNQITRQTLVPSIYSDYILKYKTEICDAFTTTSQSIYFSQCQLEDTVCMCTFDECNKDLETCRKSIGLDKNIYSIYILLVFFILEYLYLK